jgi:hypothetical protein
MGRLPSGAPGSTLASEGTRGAVGSRARQLPPPGGAGAGRDDLRDRAAGDHRRRCGALEAGRGRAAPAPPCASWRPTPLARCSPARRARQARPPCTRPSRWPDRPSTGTVKPWEPPAGRASRPAARPRARRGGGEGARRAGGRAPAADPARAKLALELEDPRARSRPSPGAAAASRFPERGADRTARRALRGAASGAADALVAADAPEATLTYLRLRPQASAWRADLRRPRARRWPSPCAYRRGVRAEVKRARGCPRGAGASSPMSPARPRAAARRAERVADLELDTRGGAPLRCGRSAVPCPRTHSRCARSRDRRLRWWLSTSGV